MPCLKVLLLLTAWDLIEWRTHRDAIQAVEGAAVHLRRCCAR
jgi:hypothetical protein